MNTIDRFLFLAALALCIGLMAGCGQVLTKPIVPVDVPLAPAVIYVPDCTAPQSGALAVMGAADRAWGEGLCRSLWSALKARISTENGRYALAHIVPKEGDPEFSPDLALEHAIGAHYRIVLQQPRSYISSIYMPNGHTEQLVAEMPLSIINAKTNEWLASIALTPHGEAAQGAWSLADELVRGLDGPRCAPVHLYSFVDTDGMAADGGNCKTFRLPATH